MTQAAPARAPSADPVADPVADPIAVSVPNDHGTLRDVVWAPITRSPANLDSLPDLLDPSLLRQAWHNRMTPFDAGRAAAQHRAFRDVLVAEGVTVHDAITLPETLTQFGTRDVGFAIDDIFVPARPRRRYRAREALGLRDLIPRLSRVAYLDFGTIEGGDVALHEGEVLVGLSEETDAEGVDALRHLLSVQGNPRKVVPLSFSHGGVIHLDTSLVVLGPDLAIAHLPTFDEASLLLLRDRFRLIETTEAEARDVQVNVVPLGRGRVVVKDSALRLIDELARHGQVPVPVPYDDVTTLPGSFHCTTLPLRRDAA